jgi:hypothetical protein
MKKLKLSASLIWLAMIQLTAITISPLPYGINVHTAQNETLAKVKAAGITWIRIDITWSQIESAKGTYNFAEVDRVADYANANGLSIYASIGSTPGWANGNQGINYPASNINDWKDFVSSIINRYKSKIKYWGIWNEPNIKYFFALDKDIFVQQILLPAAQTIRSADPAAFIVGPELAHLTQTGSEWYFWLKYILDNAGNYFDIISHHIYEDLGVYVMYELLENGDKLIPAVKQIIEESGQSSKPFWITETGWDTGKFSETMQSLRYVDMLQIRARKDYPQKVFFYEIIDDPRSSTPFGILRSNGEAKPAYYAYRDYIAGLYPDPGNPDGTNTNKKCYAEQTMSPTPAGGKMQSLRQLRNMRDYLRGYSASAKKAVNIYYELNQEFFKIALADSRIANLGREILAQAETLLTDNGWIEMSRSIPESLSRNAKAIVQIIKNEYRDTALAPLAVLADKYLSAIKRVPMHDLLEFYMKEDILKFKSN